MTLKPRLLVRPRRANTESRSNYLLRLAQQNYLSGLPELVNVVGLPPHTMLSMTDDALAQFLRGVDLGTVAPPVNRSAASLELVRRRLWNRSRICPRCVKSGHTTPIYFDFCLSLRCEEHQIYLLDHCPSCSQALTYLRKRSFHCNCGQALANLPATKVDSSVDLFESLITPWREIDNWFLDEETVLGLEVRASKALRALIDFVTGNWDTSTRHPPWIWLEDWPIIKTMISPWPSSLIESVLASDGLNNSGRLGHLLAILSDSEHPFLHKLREKLYGYRKEFRRPISVECEPLVSLSQVRKIAKLDAAASIDLFNSSYFSVKETLSGPKGPTYWVGKTEFEKLKQLLSETVSLKRAGEIIGCSTMVVRGLAKIGKLQPVLLPCKPRSPRFFRSNIDGFVKSIELNLVGDVGDGLQLIPLAKVVPATPRCKRWCSNWPKLIGRIFTGAVPIFRISGTRGWEGVGVRPDDVKACINTDHWLSDVSA